MVDKEATQQNKSNVIPEGYADPAYVEGRHYPFHLTWTEESGAPLDLYFDAETKELASQEALEILSAHPGHQDAVLGDANGDPVDITPLAPICHLINFKTRRVAMSRGEKSIADLMARGFKKVTAAHFVKFVDSAQKGFRKKKKVRK